MAGDRGNRRPAAGFFHGFYLWSVAKISVLTVSSVSDAKNVEKHLQQQ